MIYVELDKENKMTKISRKPFDEKDGLHTPMEELEKTGIFVTEDDLPEPEQRFGKIPVLKYNVETKTLYYEYKDEVITSREEMLEKNIKSLGEQLAQEKLKNMQKDMTISQLGQEIAKLKLEVISIKGGV